MLCVGENFAVICTDALEDEIDSMKIIHELNSTGHEIIEISFDQMNRFAGNMLELQNKNGDHVLIMSTTAYASLTEEQIKALEKYARIITPEINIIETAAGGGVRCMMAELFY